MGLSALLIEIRFHGLTLSTGPTLRDLPSRSVIEPPAGVQILASLDSKWTPRDLFRDVEERKHFRKSMFCWALVMVDLVRFELTTSSMP